MNLKHVYTLERAYFMQYSRYNEDLENIGFEHEKTIEENGNANYQIEITQADRNGFIARATALADVRLQRSWTLLFGVIYKKIADLLLR